MTWNTSTILNVNENPPRKFTRTSTALVGTEEWEEDGEDVVGDLMATQHSSRHGLYPGGSSTLQQNFKTAHNTTTVQPHTPTTGCRSVRWKDKRNNRRGKLSAVKAYRRHSMMIAEKIHRDFEKWDADKNTTHDFNSFAKTAEQTLNALAPMIEHFQLDSNSRLTLIEPEMFADAQTDEQYDFQETWLEFLTAIFVHRHSELNNAGDVEARLAVVEELIDLGFRLRCAVAFVYPTERRFRDSKVAFEGDGDWQKVFWVTEEGQSQDVDTYDEEWYH